MTDYKPKYAKPEPMKLKRSRTRKPKVKDPRDALIKACDRLWSLIIREQPDECEWCGGRHEVYQAHHIFSKGHSWNTRYVLMNGVKLGKGCHRKAHNEKAAEFAEWVKEKMGDRYLRLRLSSNGRFEKSESNLKLIKKQLTEIRKKLKDSYQKESNE